jgi:hypothetical protein
MKSVVLILLVLWLLCGVLSADINQYYSFQSGTQLYTPIVGTQVSSYNDPVDIGFPFHYGENIYTQLKISYYGYITFNLAINQLNSNNLNFNIYHPIIAPYWGYMNPTTPCRYLLSGIAPNRIFTVQYTDMHWTSYPWLPIAYDFQVKLHETGQIDFCYGPGVGNETVGSASIGINMDPGGIGYFLCVRLLPSLTVSSTDNYNSNSTFPAENTVFSFIPSALPEHDLIAESLTNPEPLIQNETGSFTAIINNHGTEPDSNYTVNLMEGSNVIATTTGPFIEANDGYANATLSWTPQTVGTHLLRAEVIGIDDEVPGNNVTDSISVAVFPQSTTPVTLADSTQLTFGPAIVWEYSGLVETLYLGSDINHYGTINAISYYNHFLTNVWNLPLRIWIGTTSLDNLPLNWIPSTQLTQVFDGTVNFMAGNHIICIPLDTPFSYTEQNLVVLVSKLGPDFVHTPSNTFYGLNSGSVYCSLVATSSSDNINPASPPVVDIAYQSMPKTTFHFFDGVNNPGEIPANSSELCRSYPNPFLSSTNVSIDLKESQNVNISIYNLKGQKVRTLLNGYKSKGQHTTIWDGKNSEGKVLPRGMYLLRTKHSDRIYTAKIIKY